MSDWLRRFAEEIGAEPLTSTEVGVLLDLTRDVAHGTERRSAPLAAFLAGVHAGRSSASRIEAVEEAATAARRLLAGGDVSR